MKCLLERLYKLILSPEAYLRSKNRIEAQELVPSLSDEELLDHCLHAYALADGYAEVFLYELFERNLIKSKPTQTEGRIIPFEDHL